MEKLRELRLETGLTRAELARELGLNQGTLANYENGIRQADYPTLILISTFFDVTIDYLIGKEEKASPVRSKIRPLTYTERTFIRQFQSLSETSKDIVKELIDHLAALESNV